jgi:hypothetical protein
MKPVYLTRLVFALPFGDTALAAPCVATLPADSPADAAGALPVGSDSSNDWHRHRLEALVSDAAER